jgi:ABC-type sugar transport system substrate-binding protein
MQMAVPRAWIRRALPAATVAAAMSFVAVGCGSSDKSSSDTTAKAPSAAATFTAAEVKKATAPYDVDPVYDVPKDVGDLKLAFINPGKSYPFFATWSEAMKAAAKFYGVSVSEGDLNLKYDTLLSAYQQIAVRQPTVVGTGAQVSAPFISQAKSDQSKVVLLDASSPDVPSLGVPDQQVGEMAAEKLAEAAKPKLDGDWKGRKIAFVGFSVPNCPPCIARVKAAQAKAKELLGSAISQTVTLQQKGQDPTTTAQDTVTDFLTAHPKDAILFMSYGDEPAIGAVNALKQAHRSEGGLAVALGGDSTARAALRDPSNKASLIGAIDFNPYAEGWNWVAAAIATAKGQKFKPYEVSRFLDVDNVDRYYPDDKK